MRVHQFVPTFESGAVGHHIDAVRELLTANGVGGEVFAEHRRREVATRSLAYTDYGAGYPSAPDDVLLYHVAIGSVVADFVRARPERLVVWHHNITPPEYLRPWEPRAAPGVAWGERQLLELASRAEFGIADSEFNRLDLMRNGYRDPVVVPILLDHEHLRLAPDVPTVQRLAAAKADGGSDILFVGRMVPNKCQHDLVKALACVRATCDAKARLHLVGGVAIPAYGQAVRALAAELGIGDAVEVCGAVSAAELAAHYETADLFLCLSEHEGFCVPLLEAMQHDVPIVAYAAAAVPETLGDAGVGLPEKSPALVAAAVARVLRDEPLRRELVERGRSRLAAFAPITVGSRLLDVLGAHGIGAGAP